MFWCCFAIIIFYYYFWNTATITCKKTLFLWVWALSVLHRSKEIAFIAWILIPFFHPITSTLANMPLMWLRLDVYSFFHHCYLVHSISSPYRQIVLMLQKILWATSMSWTQNKAFYIKYSSSGHKLAMGVIFIYHLRSLRITKVKNLQKHLKLIHIVLHSSNLFTEYFSMRSTRARLSTSWHLGCFQFFGVDFFFFLAILRTHRSEHQNE